MPHSELWHQLYAEEETQLRNAIGGQVVAIEHVGSTAICGLSAKPIIDIAVAVREIADAEKCVTQLEASVTNLAASLAFRVGNISQRAIREPIIYIWSN
jgi:GrpB-like predicted nucleotidyltransferase (UPF0157 family)